MKFSQWNQAKDWVVRNAVIPLPIRDAQENLLHTAEKGQAREVFGQLLQLMKKPHGTADLPRADCAKVEAAVARVRKRAKASGFSARALTLAQVHEVAAELGLKVPKDQANPIVVLNRSSPASQFVNKLSVQDKSRGVGPEIIRTYTELLRGVDADALFDALLNGFTRYQDPNGTYFYPSQPGGLEEGSRIYIRSSPINAPGNIPDHLQMGVRVKRIENSGNTRRLTLETLKGHFEAGEISFSVRKRDNDEVELQVQSDARFGGLVSRLAYPLFSKKIQGKFWESFLERVANIHGAEVVVPPYFMYQKEKI